MGKHSLLEDEIPLTLNLSPNRGTITQETRSRFDSLLRNALRQEKNDKKKQKHTKEDIIELEEHTDHEEYAYKNKGFRHSRAKSNVTFKEKNDDGENETVLSPASTSQKNVTGDIEFLSSSEDEVIVRVERTSRSETLDSPQLPKLKTRRKLDMFNESENLSSDTNKSNINQSPYKNTIVSVHASPTNDRNPAAPFRRLSYVIHKEDSSNESSPDRDISPVVLSPPVPVPRKRKGKRTLFTQEKVTDSEQIYKHKTSSPTISPSRNIVDNSSRNVFVEQHEQAPPLYSKTTASYENLEKDGGSLPRVHQKSRRKSKYVEDEEIEMQSLKMSGPTPSYEEITPSRKPSKTKPKSIVTTELQAPTPSRSDKVASDLTYEEIIGISIHRCDYLQADSLITHPLVKVYIIDSKTGEYLKKSDPNRSVSYFNESDNVDYVAPLMTHEFDFQARRSAIPCWEELIIFNEDLKCIQNKDSSVIILFEILDSVSFAVASAQYQRLGPEGGWHRVAWAFLKPVGPNGHSNIGELRRLQLYKPSTFRRANCDSCDVYAWWSRGEWKKYPSTLYVTIKGIRPPQNLPRVLRSGLALQGEHVLSTESSIDDERGGGVNGDITLPSTGNGDRVNRRRVNWSRLESQSCKIPNRRAFALQTGGKGCFTLKFSNAGLYLACAMLGQDDYPIVICSIPSGKECMQLIGHEGLVYDLRWSTDDSLLLSSSADCTACVWDWTSKTKTHLLQMLPHPGFVYCARFLPGDDSVVVTGCSDRTIRIWNKSSPTTTFQLEEELEGHPGYVTSLCFASASCLVSGDSAGRIFVWLLFDPDRIVLRDLNVRELHGTVISRVELHPGGQRLLVHARDSLLRMVDLNTGSVLQWFHGALNYRHQTSASISPCGSLVIAASEDGTVCVWNSDTGEQLAVYSGLQFPRGTSGIDYHPFEHMAAFSATDCHDGVVVCVYDKLAAGDTLGLRNLTEKVLPTSGTDDAAADNRSDKSSLFVDKHDLRSTVKKIPLGGINNESLKGDINVSYSGVSSNDEVQTNQLKLVNIIEKMDQVLLSTTPSKSISRASSPKDFRDQESKYLTDTNIEIQSDDSSEEIVKSSDKVVRKKRVEGPSNEARPHSSNSVDRNSKRIIEQTDTGRSRSSNDVGGREQTRDRSNERAERLITKKQGDRSDKGSRSEEHRLNPGNLTDTINIIDRSNESSGKSSDARSRRRSSKVNG